MNLNCIIVDDEPLAVQVIKNYLVQIKNAHLVASFNSAIDTVDYLRDHKVDLIFLDINMPILDGMNFIKSFDPKPMIIITTAYTEYAVEGYKLEVLDYLVKPIPFPRFLQAVNKALDHQKILNRVSTPEKEHLFLKIDNKRMKKVFLDDILVIESLKDYIKIKTNSERYIIHQTLSSFTDSLPAHKFIRIHRSYTIAIDKVEALEGNTVEIQGIKYTIGRSYIEEVKGVILQ